MKDKLIITPKTRVLQLLEAYPQLEDVLIGIVPAFKKLQNPMLRRTVARVATLQQAAAIGSVKVDELINRLRREVGQDLYTGSAGNAYNTAKPGWFDAKLVAGEFDARIKLAAGEQPVNQVMADLTAMAAGTVYKLSAPFLPAPLIDKAASLGIRHWLVREGEGSFVVYFYKEE
ncbi:MAG: DUF1858 domain-containing protein [Acidobacteria bacterium]|nr:DUF1858 domain-containing protein [Acidobacteriota bacterium]MBU4307039.1 DUF1858 domain-containing protein [Acidobacteriota bacterium]MBU4405779.1 DUF1858 domain-containing protein [Acidobacteriota bacterium]MCG2810244.1 DUF1858 domain-containing protein [Candidatus Aminicenantes bacterium]